jgi:GcrA cell cycle regulator
MERRMSWSDERVELLRKLWQDGLSASRIAAELGGVTRNAVIGKVHRLGLSGRAKTPRAAGPRPRKARPSLPPRPVARMLGNTALKMEAEALARPRPVRAPAPVEELFIPPDERATILSLTERSCKWPIGDPSGDDFYFCGRQSLTGVPYCEHHARIAYQPAVDRRRSAEGK